MNEEKEKLYLIVIQKQDFIIQEYQKALNQAQVGLTVVLISCLLYLIISFVVSENISRYVFMFKNLFIFKRKGNDKRNY